MYLTLFITFLSEQLLEELTHSFSMNFPSLNLFTHFYFYNFPYSEDDIYTNIPQIVFFINIGIFNSDGVPKIPYIC